MKLLSLHPIIKGIILAGLILLLFLLYRGCQYYKHKVAANAALKSALDSIRVKQKNDSLVAVENLRNYNASLEFANGIITLRENKLYATETKLLATTIDRDNYKKKYESVKPDTDTSVTMVPNEFITDAHNCFDEVEEKNKLIKQYVQENRELDSAQKIIERLQDKRISELISERNAYRQNANDAIAIAAKTQKLSERRRKVFISLGAIGEKEQFIMGVGGGGFYMDKRERLFGGNAYGTNRGPYFTANIMMPLSFRRR